ncbi:DUF5082 family protein [Clostridium polynesiense]|uniref:DUF5082 family protein n=1 Tax=Clostridium polynesiense TaxID=1325933 RepID=UPI00058AE1DE|nr:DUF5082 family protein [Clostridium polynesiense]
MATLDDLKSSLAEIKSQLKDKEKERKRYLAIASDIDAVYERLAEDKKIMKGYRDSVKDFSKESYDDFKGNLYKNSYQNSVSDLVENYNEVISNIDANMDALNLEKANYENKASRCYGLIGSFESAVNSLVHRIENWVN